MNNSQRCVILAVRAKFIHPFFNALHSLEHIQLNRILDTHSVPGATIRILWLLQQTNETTTEHFSGYRNTKKQCIHYIESQTSLFAFFSFFHFISCSVVWFWFSAKGRKLWWCAISCVFYFQAENVKSGVKTWFSLHLYGICVCIWDGIFFVSGHFNMRMTKKNISNNNVIPFSIANFCLIYSQHNANEFNAMPMQYIPDIRAINSFLSHKIMAYSSLTTIRALRMPFYFIIFGFMAIW